MASFTIDPLPPAIFGAIIRGSRQEAGDVQRLTVTVMFWDVDEWMTFQTLLTTKYHVHAPLDSLSVVDIVSGPGEGVLVIDDLGETNAILVGLDRSTYLPYARSQGSATFLVTGPPL